MKRQRSTSKTSVAQPSTPHVSGNVSRYFSPLDLSRNSVNHATAASPHVRRGSMPYDGRVDGHRQRHEEAIERDNVRRKFLGQSHA